MPPEEQAFVNYLTLWYSTQDQKAGFFSFRTLGFKEPTLNPPGVEGVFVKDADGKGSSFEYRIPWGVLRAPGPMKAGDAIHDQIAQLALGFERQLLGELDTAERSRLFRLLDRLDELELRAEAVAAEAD